MKSESLVFAVAGMFFGLIAGWLIRQPAVHAPAGGAPAGGGRAVITGRGGACHTTIRPAGGQAPRRYRPVRSSERHAAHSARQPVLDCREYDQAIKRYESALELDPTNPDVSTDLGVSYYYSNQPDRALTQFKPSLEIDPKHTKTMLNQGIVLAFGKQDLEGATKAWQQVVELAPNTPEGQAARVPSTA